METAALDVMQRESSVLVVTQNLRHDDTRCSLITEIQVHHAATVPCPPLRVYFRLLEGKGIQLVSSTSF